MKKVFLWLSGISALLGLILCFENITQSASVGLLFSFAPRSLFIVLGLLYLLGFAGGVFLGFALTHRDQPGSGKNF